MDTAMAEQVFSHGFGSDEFVDAIAARPLSHSDASSRLLAIAVSTLESNLWGGGVALLDGVSGQRLGGVARVAAGVSALAWTGDAADLLVFGCDNGDVRLMRLSTDSETEEFVLEPVASAGETIGHDDVVTCAAASAMEKTIFATAGWDLTVKLWDVTAMDKTLTTLDGHADLIWDLVQSPQEAHVLASASQDATVQLWDDRDVVQRAHSTLSTNAMAALALDWHAVQSHLISVGLENGDVLSFDTRATKTPLTSVSVSEGAIHSVQYSPTASDLLAVGSDDATASLVTNGSSPDALVHPLASSRVHQDYVRALAWYSLPDSPQQPVLATGSWDHSLRVWRLADL